MIKRLLLVLLCTTFISCNMCRSGNSNVSVDPDPHPPIQASEDTLSICSFNIMWLGSYKKKDELALASLLQNYDIVVIQELVAPPFDGTYPDETEFESDTEALEFFNAMENVGFSHVLSEEDTGPNSEIHSISSTTEWWVCFYNDDKVDIAGDLPIGFLETDRSANPNYKRVPYAFGFRKDELDVVLISVHLAPGDDDEDTQFRAHEFQSIFSWIDSHNDTEKDFIVLGDMNIENLEELNNITPSGYLSLNDECRKTNTAAGTDKPYDHVIYNISNTANEIDIEYDLEVIDLVEAMRDRWESGEPYPGDPYDHNLFKQYYSDHNPVVFRMVIPANDDD